MPEMDTLLGGVLRRIKPGDGERQRLQEISGRLISLIDRIAADAGISAHGMLVGSAARGTWLSGECDLDIFICFPEQATRAELEEKGLAIARAAAADAQESEERYAEHPYVHAVFDGYDVDLVPCFEVADVASIKSAVDRSPFHNRYVLEKIAGIKDEVLLLKQFMKGAGVYGSELKTRGFSGYLAELLVIRYGSFTKVLEDACGWVPGKIIDIEHHAAAVQSDPLVVVDPTDPGRNVAAALSLENMCRFIDRACEFISSPGAEFFFPAPVAPMTAPELEALLAARGTSLLAIAFEPPDVVEDVLFPQLRKLEQSAKELLERKEFRVFAS
ncbi:MAG TPA: CCA tRNA nucleotidyltransferase, partial [Candidatus Methanoperedenaceae archaeon]|nr:CCA tRNA nucleotidyltransferase [Candidatus Methanoperedenaceae archaeon]